MLDVCLPMMTISIRHIFSKKQLYFGPSQGLLYTVINLGNLFSNIFETLSFLILGHYVKFYKDILQLICVKIPLLFQELL